MPTGKMGYCKDKVGKLKSKAYKKGMGKDYYKKGKSSSKKGY